MRAHAQQEKQKQQTLVEKTVHTVISLKHTTILLQGEQECLCQNLLSDKHP
ncbi:MAG: hypothetical protein ACFFDI_08260 [Promethearchaeota archaeon]